MSSGLGMLFGATAVLTVAACGDFKSVGPEAASVRADRVASGTGPIQCTPSSSFRKSLACLDARIHDIHGPVFPNPMPEKNLVVTNPRALPLRRRSVNDSLAPCLSPVTAMRVGSLMATTRAWGQETYRS